jgi:hypothetical protein
MIGAVPSGVHRLLQGLSRPIAWDRKEFGLLDISSEDAQRSGWRAHATATYRRIGDS